MRIFGYILLLFGFLWLVVWCEGSVAPLARSIGTENFKEYMPTNMYSGEEVCSAMRHVLTEYQENYHGVILPAVLMFIGGIFLDFSAKRNRRELSPTN